MKTHTHTLWATLRLGRTCGMTLNPEATDGLVEITVFELELCFAASKYSSVSNVESGEIMT